MIMTYTIAILQAIGILMITVLVHEAGHTIAARLCGVKVEAFGIGFGKPYIHKKFFGIDFRLSPWLLGGYTAMAGEYDKTPNGFMAQPYHKKVIILSSGVIMNLILAFICYWINYKSFIFGVYIDYMLLKTMFVKNNLSVLLNIFNAINPNIFLLQLSMLNLFCAIFNLIPFPALDGSLFWIFGMENCFTRKNFVKFVKYITYIGFTILMIAQLTLLAYWYLI